MAIRGRLEAAFRVTLILSPPVRPARRARVAITFPGRSGPRCSRNAAWNPVAPVPLSAQPIVMPSGSPARASRLRTCSTGSPGGKSPGPRPAHRPGQDAQTPGQPRAPPTILPARPGKWPAAPVASTMPSGSRPKTRPGPVPAARRASADRFRSPGGIRIKAPPGSPVTASPTSRTATARFPRPARLSHTTPAHGDHATTRRRADQPQST